jgi:hypothetical protein
MQAAGNRAPAVAPKEGKRGDEEMRLSIATLMTAASLALNSSDAFAQNVSYDFDKAAAFSGFKTYAWVRGTELNDALNHKRIVNAVDAQLASKGLVRVEPNANPDVLVAYHASFDKDLQINGFSSGWGGFRFAANRSGSARVNEILIGTLAVDIVDAKTKTIVWRGMATKEIDTSASAEKREKNVNKAAEKLFKNYPPL